MKTNLHLLPMPLLALTACTLGYSRFTVPSELDEWCGDRLCHWTLEAGSIHPVSTWHASERGIQFGRDAVLSRTLEGRDDCLSVTMLADAEPEARLTLEVDYLDDGRPEIRQQVVGRDYELLRYVFASPDWYQGLRIRLLSDGVGQVRIARVSIESLSAFDCPGVPTPLNHRPLGAPCSEDSECEAEICERNTCMACRDDAQCGAAEVCSWADPAATDWNFLGCIVRSSIPEGGRCRTDEACSAHGCHVGRCQCADSGTCPEGQVCGWGRSGRGEPGQPANACVPVASVPISEHCRVDDECISGACCGYICVDPADGTNPCG